MTEKSEKTLRFDVILNALFYTGIFAVYFYVFYVQAFSLNYTAELKLHIEILEKLIANPLSGESVHPGFHLLIYALSKVFNLTLSYSAVILLSLFAVWISYLIKKLLDCYLPNLGSGYKYFSTLMLVLVSSIYLPFFSSRFYLGQGTPNFWATPTLVVLKPFSLIAFFMFIKYLDRASLQKNWFYQFTLTLVLAVSVVVKPSFVFVFFPAVFIYLLISHKMNLKILYKLLIMALPSLLILAVQYFGNFVLDKGQGIDLVKFRVWQFYTPSIPISILLAIAFPLSILVSRFRMAIKFTPLVLSWLMLIIGAMQFAFLAEKKYFYAGNFSWGYNIALWFLFIFSFIEFVKWINEKEAFRNGINRLAITLTAIIFGLHLWSGVFYLIHQILEKGYY